MYSTEMLKLRKQITSQLEDLDIPDSVRIAREIVTHTQDPNEVNKILKLIKKHQPWEYIRGWAEFMGLKFKVTTSTLIPRVETEELVELAIKLIQPNSTIIDVGTGCGAIITGLGSILGPTYSYLATDISKEALAVAKTNFDTHGINVTSYETNSIKDIPQQDLDKPLMIIANLPYIPTNDYEILEKSVKDYEPKVALEGGENGTYVIFELLDQIIELDNTPYPYEILLEVDPSSIGAIREHTVMMPEYTMHVIKDFRGMNRFVRLELTNPPQQK